MNLSNLIFLRDILKLLPHKKRSRYQHLREKWAHRQSQQQQNLWNKHRGALEWLSKNVSPKQLAIGSLGSLMMLAAPVFIPASHNILTAKEKITKDIDKSVFLISDLSNILPKEMRSLTNEEEEKIAQILSRDFGLTVKAELDGKRLNRSYGLIGSEQHLARFPGDNMNIHFDTQEEARMHHSSGMAPGLGAWGYFTPSGQNLSEIDKLREKYYIAVQTFLAPGFNEHVAEYGIFFKYRKMLVVNPQNGKAIIAVIGDAGPADWTGKHLGGSPEVMRYLEREDGARKGPVLYFFIEDLGNRVPLGPIKI